MSERQAAPGRAPAVVLGSVIGLVGCCALFPGAMLVVTLVHSLGQGVFRPDVLLVILPLLLGFALSIFLWTRARRAPTPRRRWLLALVGVVLVLAGSYQPISLTAQLFYEEWSESQPGGRGYYPD